MKAYEELFWPDSIYSSNFMSGSASQVSLKIETELRVQSQASGTMASYFFTLTAHKSLSTCQDGNIIFLTNENKYNMTIGDPI